MARALLRNCIVSLWLAWIAMSTASADPGSSSATAEEAASAVPMPSRSEDSIDMVAIAAYVAQVDGRLRGGRYKRLDASDQDWIRAQIRALQLALPQAVDSPEAGLALRRQVLDFESRMVLLDQGGIVCRLERRTGSSLMSRRCLTRKLLEQQTLAEQERWRRMSRPGTGTSKSMALTALR